MTTDTGTAAPPRHAAPPPPPASGGRRSWRGRLGHWDIKFAPYLLVAPFFILFAIFGLFPILYTAYTSMFRWSLRSPVHEFVGFDNYSAVLGQERFWNAA